MTKPSRLYRRLADRLALPLFRLTVNGWENQDDNTIQAVTINRGLGQPGGGVAVTTLEVDVAGDFAQAPFTGSSIRLVINDTTALRYLTGVLGRPATDFADRFRGRVGPIEVPDNGNGRTMSTKLTCSSWISQEAYSGRKRTLTRPTFLNDAVQQLMYAEGRLYTMHSYGERDVLYETIENTTYGDEINKLTADYEILIGDLRNGDARFMYLPWRVEQAAARVYTQAPLMRSQVIAPAKWEQANETYATKYEIRFVGPDGNMTGTTRYSQSSLAPAADTRDLDWSYIQSRTNHWDFASRAIIYRQTTNRFAIPSVKVDLLRLLTSDNPYDRRVAGELILAETGDTVNLAGDWPNLIGGVYVITGMTEKITPDEWSINMSLATASAALGTVLSDIPDQDNIPPLVWDQATRTRWSDDDRKWNH